jgi:hypothetical protein
LLDLAQTEKLGRKLVRKLSQLEKLVLQESNWLLLSMVLSAGIVAASRLRSIVHAVPGSDIVRMLNLFYGSLIGIMAIGHLSAVSIKMANGTLRGSVPVLYAIGLALFIPAWWLVFNITRYVRDLDRYRQAIISLNVALGVVLLAIGLPNIPLALPAFINVGYQLHHRRGLVVVNVVLYSALFLGGAAFFASGKTFEELSR